jgi:large subunit ribosomal protein L22
MPYKYSFQGPAGTYARAVGTGIRVSTKQAIEISQYLRGRSTKQAKRLLEEVVVKKRAIPFTKFTTDVGHKPGIASGRYPINAAKEFIKLISSVEHNARFKGMNTQNLIISHLVAQGAGKAYHYGRYSRREMKYSHVEIVVAEAAAESAKETKKTTKHAKKEDKQ